MADKLQGAREYILHRIDSGEFNGGGKLPSARAISQQAKISFTIVQMAFNTLIADGIISSGVSRQGSHVRKDWNNRILPGSFLSFRPVWQELFLRKIHPLIPELTEVSNFRYGAYEIGTTYDAVSRQNDYLDLSEFLDAEYPDRDDFFNARIEQFRSHDGKLFALPLMFSPWVFRCDEDLIRRGGVEIPDADWDWADFIRLLRQLREKLPADQILDSSNNSSRWLIYLTRAGGKIFDCADAEYTVRLDSPETLEALRHVQELYHTLPRTEPHTAGDGRCALRLCSRQDIPAGELTGKYIALPRVPGVPNHSLMAGDLLCIRKTVNNFDMVRKVIRALLSPELQGELAARRYGIPIRKSAAIQSFDERAPQDRIFFSEMTGIAEIPHYAWPIVNELLREAMADFLYSTRSPRDFAAELAPALKAILKYSKSEKQ